MRSTFFLTLTRLVLLLIVALLTSLPSAKPAGAIFHIAIIDELMSGFGGDPDVQYIEVRMDFPGQHLVHDTVLSVFDEDSDPALTVLLILPDDVPNDGVDVRWLMATQAFADLTGTTPDFIMPPGVLASKGMVCWGAPDFAPPSDQWPGDDPDTPGEDGYNFPFFYTDCVSYGGYAGPPFPVHPPATGLPPGDGAMSLQRTAPLAPTASGRDGFTPSHLSAPPDADAFELNCPTPENNAGRVALLGPDDDSDGLSNCNDNCPQSTGDPADPDQTDIDLDGAGVPCDPDDAVYDVDQDGCADGEEQGPDETRGGRRDPTSFWDFFDPNRDLSVGFQDFLAVLRHFSAVGDPSTLDPDAPEPPAGEYWALADRGGQAPGEDLWDELPANGSIGFSDFLSVLRQFGHSCALPP